MRSMGGPSQREAAGAGDDPVIAAYRRDLDVSLIRDRLRLSVEERLVELQRLHNFAIELARAGEREQHRSHA